MRTIEEISDDDTDCFFSIQNLSFPEHHQGNTSAENSSEKFLNYTFPNEHEDSSGKGVKTLNYMSFSNEDSSSAQQNRNDKFLNYTFPNEHADPSAGLISGKTGNCSGKFQNLESPINDYPAGKSFPGKHNSSPKSDSQSRYVLRRLVSKTGSCRVAKLQSSRNEPVLTQVVDAFTSLIECRWRWILAWFTLSFIGTWFLFAILWWIIAYHHGDLKSSKVRDPFNDTAPCVTGLDDFVACYLFSMETQYSTGYGSRLPNTHCPEAIFLVSVQSVFGVLINALAGGIIFAKLAKPKKRCQNLVFSDKAVICQRDGIYHLIWRIGDLRKSHLIGVKLRAWFLCRRVTREGEMLPRYKYALDISVDDGGPDTLFQWPLEVCHRITPRSPLYHLSAVDLLTSKFELVTSLNGTLESSGTTIEARSSYLPSEILWGNRFLPMFIKKDCKYYVDYARFVRVSIF
uniref:ATP-sensitive inward rectifier potassium channel 12 n=1 Tax=Cacopsylla melanoneura TaxID=428564 RepID=A0A8D9ETA7_9HEMI